MRVKKLATGASWNGRAKMLAGSQKTGILLTDQEFARLHRAEIPTFVAAEMVLSPENSIILVKTVIDTPFKPAPDRCRIRNQDGST
jgi:hypothetical protein